MILPIIQVGVVIGRGNGNGGGGEINPPNRSLPANMPTNVQRPTINQPTSRPTIAQPTAMPTFTRSAFTSFSFTRTAQTSYTSSPSFTRTQITRTFTTQTSYTFNPTFTQTYTTNYNYPGYWYPGMPFIHYGTGWSPSTGSFTLGQTLYGPNNTPCLYYTYFQFNAPAGMMIQAQLWTTGLPIQYIVVPMSAVSLFQTNGCNYLNALSHGNTIGSTPYIYTWTAPQAGEYAIIFYSTTPYSNTVYFIPQ